MWVASTEATAYLCQLAEAPGANSVCFGLSLIPPTRLAATWAFWMFWYIRPEEAESILELEEDVGMLNTEFTDEESQKAVLVLWVT